MRDVDDRKVAEYACEDADVTLQVANAIRPDIETRGVSQVCYEVECPLIPVLVDMEYQGIRLDTEALAIFSEKLESRSSNCSDRSLSRRATNSISIRPSNWESCSTKSCELETNPKKTSTGQYSTRETELQRLVRPASDHRGRARLSQRAQVEDRLCRPASGCGERDGATAHALQPSLDRDGADAVERSEPANDSGSQRAGPRYSRRICPA